MNSLYILGSGNPVPAPGHYGSSYVLRLGDEHLMFDCGPATTHKLVEMGISPTNIDYLYFTHHHFDHDVDYPCFLLTRWDTGSGQENTLQVFGPTLTEQLTERILDENVGAYAHDWKARVNHPLSLGAYTSRGGVLPRKPPMLDVKDIEPGPVSKGKDWEVVSAPAEHVQPWLDSLAYRVDSSQGSFVFTGDTHPCQSIAELAKGADVLVFVCVGIQAEIDGTPEAKYMSGTTDAARLAQEAGAKKLVLVHNTRMAAAGKMERAILDVGKVFDGEIVMGRDMLEVPV